MLATHNSLCIHNVCSFASLRTQHACKSSPLHPLGLQPPFYHPRHLNTTFFNHPTLFLLLPPVPSTAPWFSQIPLCIFPSNLKYKPALFYLSSLHLCMLSCCFPSSHQCTITGRLALITIPASQEALISLSQQLTLSCKQEKV